MINLIINEFRKIKVVKLLFTMFLLVISLLLINKYSNNSLFDMSYNLIPFVGVFISLLFSGSICSEIENGSMKYYLTKPFKRFKIYISKILAIIIYIFFSYIVITLSVSLINGIFDYKYFYKYFIHMIPIFFMSSYIMYLSTYCKNHVFVSCTSILTLCFSLTLSQLLFGLSFNIVEYSFLPYLDFSIFNDKLLINQMNNELGISLSLKNGLIIDSIYFIIFFIIGLFKFNKKDIKY